VASGVVIFATGILYVGVLLLLLAQFLPKGAKLIQVDQS
jgi:hypothetical protein